MRSPWSAWGRSISLSQRSSPASSGTPRPAGASNRGARAQRRRGRLRMRTSISGCFGRKRARPTCYCHAQAPVPFFGTALGRLDLGGCARGGLFSLRSFISSGAGGPSNSTAEPCAGETKKKTSPGSSQPSLCRTGAGTVNVKVLLAVAVPMNSRSGRLGGWAGRRSCPVRHLGL